LPAHAIKVCFNETNADFFLGLFFPPQMPDALILGEEKTGSAKSVSVLGHAHCSCPADVVVTSGHSIIYQH